MKLRVRSLESKETLKIEVPNSWSLQQLKDHLSQAIMSSSSSSIHLSLNRKDELEAPSPNSPIQSLGIASGDLVFYSLNPNSFSAQTLAYSLSASQSNPGREIGDLGPQELEFEKLGTPVQICSNESTPEPEIGNFETSVGKSPNPETLARVLTDYDESEGKESNSDREIGNLGSRELESEKSETPEPKIGHFETSVGKSPNPETLARVLTDSEKSEGKESNSVAGEAVRAEDMEVDGAEDMEVEDGEGSVVMGKKLSEPSFLRRVLREELGDYGNDQKLLVLAVHAVMLETGFTGFDSASGSLVGRLHLPEEWPSTASTMSLWYTLPELVVDGIGTNSIETVVLKFQSLGQFVSVYGCLGNVGSGMHRVCLNKYRFAPTIDLVWAKNDSSYKTNSTNSSSYPETEVFEFWKIVKDGLALPLLIDLCEKSGLIPPPCFTRLPTELKLKILESLSGLDTARVSCVCSELLYLSSSNDLWRQKFFDEFGSSVMVREGINWKETFASSWECKKRRKKEATRWQGFPRFNGPYYFPGRRDPNVFGIPGTIGGDYDRFPGLGIPSPFGQPGLQFPRIRRHDFSPSCNLGGFNG